MLRWAPGVVCGALYSQFTRDYIIDSEVRGEQ